MPLNLSNHKAIDAYYAALATYHTQEVTHEPATRLAFSTLPRSRSSRSASPS